MFHANFCHFFPDKSYATCLRYVDAPQSAQFLSKKRSLFIYKRAPEKNSLFKIVSPLLQIKRNTTNAKSQKVMRWLKCQRTWRGANTMDIFNLKYTREWKSARELDIWTSKCIIVILSHFRLKRHKPEAEFLRNFATPWQLFRSPLNVSSGAAKVSVCLTIY